MGAERIRAGQAMLEIGLRASLLFNFTRKPPSSDQTVKQPQVSLALAAALVVSFNTGCITETESSVRQAQGMRTEGVIITGDIDAIWQRTQRVVASMTSAPLESRGLARSLRTTVNGVEVTALVEAYDASRTIVHVTSEDGVLADRIRMRIMSGS